MAAAPSSSEGVGPLAPSERLPTQSVRSRKANARLISLFLRGGGEVPGLKAALETSRDPDLIGRDPDLLLSLQKYLREQPERAWRKLNRICPISDTLMETLLPHCFSHFSAWFIIGCPHSTDLDVVVFVDRHEDGQPRPLSSSEEARLHREIREEGYEGGESREYDISLVVEENGDIIASSKGSAETQNILLSTYRHHKQRYPPPRLNLVEVDIGEKLRVIAKFIADRLEFLMGKDAYVKKERERKKAKYKEGMEALLEYSRTLLPEFIPFSEDEHWVDSMKSLVLKYAQLVLLSHRETEYTKAGVAERIKTLTSIEIGAGCEWFLFRGKRGAYSWKSLEFLHEEYCRLIDEHAKKFVESLTTISVPSLPNPTRLPESLFRSFLGSPLVPTDAFEDQWNSSFGCRSEINAQFPIECMGEEEAQNLLPVSLLRHFIFITQRSQEWLKLLTFYTCGKNSKNIGEAFESKYNLIRGSVTELLVTHLFDPTTVEGLEGGNDLVKCQMGFIVEEPGVEGSPGSAPDLFLIGRNRIVPVEIKTLKSGKKNGDYNRGIDLAQRQCKGTRDILRKVGGGEVRIDQGLILLAWYESDQLCMKSLVFDFN
uniref:Uncharacterized protein n=1 Tax=Chromera velia CCMP2878 TaxID=1169474 RepID=A0A0G4GY24_9ALVE|eukprot:Cvel_23857.t1-p1 / transcript=Cvel_23857.t1 / gene=Cvel_23857 / organism=Chromera_velia_CCMP2878 / gene_product=hypothetical protein / transcript_product=hypothetical protein / location=Cvel_scaffold2510:11896-13692(-) / protein_length=599 / sequence_SO=supercontig / SO=protein_coding / is_pseudo=false